MCSILDRPNGFALKSTCSSYFNLSVNVTYRKDFDSYHSIYVKAFKSPQSLPPCVLAFSHKFSTQAQHTWIQATVCIQLTVKSDF